MGFYFTEFFTQFNHWFLSCVSKLKQDLEKTKKIQISVQKFKNRKRTSQFLFPPSIFISIFRPNFQLLVQGEYTFPFYHPSTIPVDLKSPTRHHHSNVNRLIHGYTRVELRCQRQSWTGFSKVAALGPVHVRRGSCWSYSIGKLHDKCQNSMTKRRGIVHDRPRDTNPRNSNEISEMK